MIKKVDNNTRFFIGVYLWFTLASTSCTTAPKAPKPLFYDPHYHGSCDPEIVWNTHTREWWIFYTARRATRKQATYVGTPIGVAASKDLQRWRFVGYCSFDGAQGKPDMSVTFWAPGIIRVGNSYHMFVTFKNNARPPWGGSGNIVHYTAPAENLLAGWKKVSVPEFAKPDPIDATLVKAGDRFRAYYRVGKGGGIHWAESDDLIDWTNMGQCPGDINNRSQHGFGYQEAPYVFKWKDYFWMLTDPHKGLGVFQSVDGITWKLNGRILAEPGTGPQDHTLARHPSVVVIQDRAFIFYHVEPNRPYPSPPAEKRTVEQKISFLQMAELELNDGQLICDRNKTIRLDGLFSENQ